MRRVVRAVVTKCEIGDVSNLESVDEIKKVYEEFKQELQRVS